MHRCIRRDAGRRHTRELVRQLPYTGARAQRVGQPARPASLYLGGLQRGSGCRLCSPGSPRRSEPTDRQSSAGPTSSKLSLPVAQALGTLYVSAGLYDHTMFDTVRRHRAPLHASGMSLVPRAWCIVTAWFCPVQELRWTENRMNGRRRHAQWPQRSVEEGPGSAGRRALRRHPAQLQR